MTPLQEIINGVCSKATNSRPFKFNYITVVSAQKRTIAGAEFRVTKQPQDRFVLHLAELGKDTLVHLGEVRAYAAMITNNALAPTRYTKVMDDFIFQKLYDVTERPLSYIECGEMIIRSTLSAPCMICGIILPLRNLTIDHQRPQSGGGLEAVVKTFRGLGLTTEGPQGPKGIAILNHVKQAIPLSAAQTQQGRPPLNGASLSNRYTLNQMGAALYSFVEIAGAAGVLESQCMHGVFNLRPVCGACNSDRGNPIKFERDVCP